MSQHPTGVLGRAVGGITEGLLGAEKIRLGRGTQTLKRQRLELDKQKAEQVRVQNVFKQGLEISKIKPQEGIEFLREKLPGMGFEDVDFSGITPDGNFLIYDGTNPQTGKSASFLLNKDTGEITPAIDTHGNPISPKSAGATFKGANLTRNQLLNQIRKTEAEIKKLRAFQFQVGQGVFNTPEKIQDAVALDPKLAGVITDSQELNRQLEAKINRLNELNAEFRGTAQPTPQPQPQPQPAPAGPPPLTTSGAFPVTQPPSLSITGTPGLPQSPESQETGGDFVKRVMQGF